jgi:succinyl-diaminopimelate desuccinylase
MSHAVDRYITRNARRAVALLQDTVRIPTENPPGVRYIECARLLASQLKNAGLSTRLIAAPAAAQRRALPGAALNPRTNVVGFLDVGAKRTLHFNAHYDVVPVSGKWKFGPFVPRQSGGWIYGRGTSDMKGSIASLIHALEAVSATRSQPHCNIEVSFTADEETDSRFGADWLTRHGGLRADYALVMEGATGRSICCGHNGCLWFEVTITGKSAHGSTPERGVNALEQLALLLVELQPYKALIGARTFNAPDGRVLRPTVNFGGSFGGNTGGKVNTVPGLASFTVDRRVLPGEDTAAAEREFRECVAAAAMKIPGIRVRVEKFTESVALFSPPDAPFFQAVAASLRRVRRTPAVPWVASGFNDMHFFSRNLGIPVAGYGPSGENDHGIDERVSVKDLTTVSRIYADVMLNFRG